MHTFLGRALLVGAYRFPGLNDAIRIPGYLSDSPEVGHRVKRKRKFLNVLIFDLVAQTNVRGSLHPSFFECRYTHSTSAGAPLVRTMISMDLNYG